MAQVQMDIGRPAPLRLFGKGQPFRCWLSVSWRTNIIKSMTPKDPQLTGLDLCWEAKGLLKTPANLREIYQQAEDFTEDTD